MLLIVDNASGELMTGAFANVRFEIPAPNSTINVPGSALIFDQSGLRVATIDSKNRVVLKTVTIARDLGSLVEIGSGLNADDRVVANPPDGITSGDEVRIAGEPGAKGAPDTASAKRQPGG
jgi:multidrug efflux pump subunit AcrA (membrane-fusion protein)